MEPNVAYETPQSLYTQPRPAIHLEGWGMKVEEVQALARTLQELMPSFDWHAGETPVPGALALVLVDEGALAGDTRGALWNTYGPVEAMRRARQDGGAAAVAVCRGRISRLPPERVGVWVTTSSEDWTQSLHALVRALVALEWEPRRGYKDVAAWRGLREFSQANLLAVMTSNEDVADFAGLARQAFSVAMVAPAALLVAGASRADVERTLVEAGVQDTQIVVVAPMTLDGVVRVDALVGFPWLGPVQSD